MKVSNLQVRKTRQLYPFWRSAETLKSQQSRLGVSASAAGFKLSTFVGVSM